ncbi:clasp N terminal-domain-containing protein [Amylocystis lapponica]|nr:clasp N terminal-domain-containing protein [Amylocystis lapponica]
MTSQRKCTSLTMFDQELRSFRDQLSLTETEDTWDNIARAITRFDTLLQGSVAQFPREVSTAIRSQARPLISAINSERSRLSGVAVDFLHACASSLGREFGPLLPLFLPALLALCTRPNKVFITRARACITAFIEHTQSPTILPYLVEAAKDKSVSLRLTAAESVMACLNSFNPPDLEKEPRAREVEVMIRTTATDPNADIRRVGRKIFEAYKILLPKRVASFTDPLTPIIKKYLDIKASAPHASRSNPPSRPQSSQSTHSLRDTTSKAEFSSSTSALRSTSSSTSVGPQRLANHGRSVSRAKPHSTSTSQNPVPHRDRGKHLPPSDRPDTDHMPPPNYIPVRPIEVASVPPDRPTTALRGAARPLPPHESAVRVKTGPMRPSSDDAAKGHVGHDGGKERVVGGARRVLLIPPPSAAVVASSDVASSRNSSPEDEALQEAANVRKKQIAERAKSKPTFRGKVRSDAKPIWGRPPQKRLGRTGASDKAGTKNAQKTTAGSKPATDSRPEVVPEETPLPPSPDAPALVPLPPSPVVLPRKDIEEVPVTPERPAAENKYAMVAQTPISALVACIEQGFLSSPSSPSLVLPKTTKPLHVGNEDDRRKPSWARLTR